MPLTIRISTSEFQDVGLQFEDVKQIWFVDVDCGIVIFEHLGQRQAWEGGSIHFTLLFEQVAMSLAREMPANTVARHVGTTGKSIWRIIHHYVFKAMRKIDLSGTTTATATPATTHMMLQAWSEGIGSCWITWFDPAIVCSEFALPENVVPVNILVLGYAAGESGAAQSPCRHQQQRMPLADMVWRENLPCSLRK